MTFINTKGMAFFGPGSEWFWAALQFTALAITFIAIYRQLRIARSVRGVEQVAAYTRQFEDERMYRHQLTILLALRDGIEIPRAAGVILGNFLENLGGLSRSRHLDVNLLWRLFDSETRIWWAVLQPIVRSERAMQGDQAWSDFEWLVGEFVRRDRRAGFPIDDEARVARWLQAGAIESREQIIRVEQALRSVVIASPNDLGTAPAPTAVPAPSRTAESEQERQSD